MTSATPPPRTGAATGPRGGGELRGKRRSARGRAGAARRAVPVPDRGPLQWRPATTGERAAPQLLGRQVPPRDALVARRPLRPLGPAVAAGAQPRLVSRDPAARTRHRLAAGVRRGPVAEAGRAG